ncbi:MAG: cytochrome c3 family protein [Deltaproteobacteria bacterium]|nr:cytochrome c3 family protein [Deltaproteobacteria bacterium]
MSRDLVRRVRVVVLVVLACAFAGALADDRAPSGRDGDPSWSPIVYPAQRLPLVFSHRQHLARGATCATCHPTATTSRSAVDNLIPGEAACRACHPIDRAQPDGVPGAAAPTACRACHPGWQPGGVVERVYLVPAPLKFDHAAHAKQACDRCHGDMRRVDLATTRQLPAMSTCLGCHTTGTQVRRCADCHMTKLGGLMETRFAHGTLVPRATGLGDDHRLGFAKDHRLEASQPGATCAACHDRSECIACHDGQAKPMDFHPGNYVLTHAVEARRGKPDCSACHRAQTFCVGCHERSGVGRRGQTDYNTVDPGRAFHPPGWASSLGGENRHAGEARRNVAACASCHRDDECLKCHSAQPGAPRFSPHGPGWRSSARCKALDRGNRRMCLRCHVTAEELGCDWRAR